MVILQEQQQEVQMQKVENTDGNQKEKFSRTKYHILPTLDPHDLHVTAKSSI